MTKRLILVVAFLLLASETPGSQSSVKLREHYDKEFKFGFKYPSSWDRDVSRKPIGDEAHIEVVTVSPPASMRRGQLFEASVSVDVTKDRVSEKGCNEFTGPSGDGSLNPVKIQAGSRTFHKVSNIVTNLSNREQTDVYNTFHDGRCYSVVLSVQRKDVKAPDRNIRLVNDSFETVLRTLYFRK